MPVCVGLNVCSFVRGRTCIILCANVQSASVSVCALAAGCVIVLGAEVLPVYHGAASFLPHIFQPLEDEEVSVKPSALYPLLVSSYCLLTPS